MAITQVQKHAIVYQILDLPGIGPVKFWKEFNKSKNLENAHNHFKSFFTCINTDIYIKKIQYLQEKGIFCIGFWQNEYPNQLKRLNDSPPLIWVKGNTDFLKNQHVAIVGGRNASFHGIKFAKDLSINLGKNGFTIVSGLARGIDKSAHEGALGTGTIAVLAGGIDKLYPKDNQMLYEELLKNHLVVSEMPPGTEPTAALFPRRNRIIAGLSQAICVIEAAIKSGSLLTAKFALDIGIPIFSCPGHPYDPRSKGSNALIKDGAYLLESANDVTEQIGWKGTETPYVEQFKVHNVATKDTHKIAQEILQYLNHTPVTIAELLEYFAHYPTNLVFITLSDLELKDNVYRPNADLIVLG